MSAMQYQDKHGIVEALVLASPEPLPVARMCQVIEELTPSMVTGIIADLNNRYMETGSSFRIRLIAGGYQYYVVPEYASYVDDLLVRRRKLRLTRAALETLAVVAYRQPVTKTDLEHIRGVACDGVLQNLMEKNLITISGRAETVGRPLQYATTDEFLKFFGLASLEALPKMSEIEEMLALAEPKPTDDEMAGGIARDADQPELSLDVQPSDLLVEAMAAERRAITLQRGGEEIADDTVVESSPETEAEPVASEKSSA